MWALILCVSVAGGGCRDAMPIFFAGKVFCERAMIEAKKRPDVLGLRCQPAA